MPATAWFGSGLCRRGQSGDQSQTQSQGDKLTFLWRTPSCSTSRAATIRLGLSGMVLDRPMVCRTNPLLEEGPEFTAA